MFEELKSYSAWFNLKSIERILREILVHTVKQCVWKYLFMQGKKCLNFLIKVHIAKWNVLKFQAKGLVFTTAEYIVNRWFIIMEENFL